MAPGGFFLERSEKYYLRALGADPRKSVANLHVCVCVCVYVCVCVCARVCACVCMFVHFTLKTNCVRARAENSLC